MACRLSRLRTLGGRFGFCVAATLLWAVAHGDVLLDEAHTVTVGAPADERVLAVSQNATLEVDVADLAFPAALASIRVAVTQGATLVAAPISAPGKITFAATAGSTYQIRIVGRPDPAKYAGSVAVNVVRTSDQAALMQYVASFQLPGIVPGLSVVNQSITIPEAGDYTFTITDHGFPVAFPSGSLSATVVYGNGSLGQALPGQPLKLTGLPASVAGSATQYKVTVVAQAAAPALSGLYGLTITGGPSANVVFDQSQPVGLIGQPQAVGNPSAGPVTLQVTDFGFPAPLTQVGAVLTAGGTRVGTPQMGAGTVTAAAPAGSLEVWRVAQAGAAGGSYLIAVSTGATPLYSDARGVSSASPTGANAYTFPFNLRAAGAYTAQVTDFQFPSALQSLQFAVVQNGTVLQSANAAGAANFTGAAGSGAVLVIAQAVSGGTGLFGTQVLATGAGGATVVDTTQAVGAVFDTRDIVVLSSGPYDVTLTDAGWPANFQNLSLALTSGGQLVGKIFAGGTFSFNATPGHYIATFIATPAPAENAGLYGIRVASSAPTVTLSADSTQIQSGQGVRLTWSSTGASSCTASGAWLGSEPTSGSAVAVGPLTANSTFTLTCSGPGGTSPPASVTITVTAKPSSGGGGGSFGTPALLALAMPTLLRALRRRPKASRAIA